MDVSDVTSVKHAFDTIGKRTRHIDLLINNAGISAPTHPHDPVETADPNIMTKIYQTNVV
jgi:NAD(P)-dependent dehydrogenase (short-subunit alcohol dehydrogenase family)